MLRIANFSNWWVVTKSAHCFCCHGDIIEVVLRDVVDKREFLNKFRQFKLSTNSSLIKEATDILRTSHLYKKMRKKCGENNRGRDVTDMRFYDFLSPTI